MRLLNSCILITAYVILATAPMAHAGASKCWIEGFAPEKCQIRTTKELNGWVADTLETPKGIWIVRRQPGGAKADVDMILKDHEGKLKPGSHTKGAGTYSQLGNKVTVQFNWLRTNRAGKLVYTK